MVSRQMLDAEGLKKEAKEGVKERKANYQDRKLWEFLQLL